MEAINCKFFIIPNFTKKHLYFFMFIFGILLRVFFPDLIKSLNSDTSENQDSLEYYLTQKYFEIARNIGSSLLLGIPHFYYILVNKYEGRKKNKLSYNTQKVDFIYNEQKSYIPNMLKIILVISTVDIICQLLIPLKCIIEDKKQNLQHYHLYFLLCFDIFARYFFSRIILKTYFYIHHKLSFLLNIIGLIPITIIDILNKCTLSSKSDKSFTPFFIVIISLQLILYSFEDIMNKVAFRSLSILPCTLIFYNGLCELAYFAIISILFFTFGYYNQGQDLYYQFKIFIGYVPFDIIRRIYLIRVIDKFSAQHMTLLKVSEAICIYLYTNIAEGFKFRNKNNNFNLDGWQYFIQIIGFVILFISTLIHNELIIINNPKLKAKTEYYLGKDAYKELNRSLTSDTFFTTSNLSDTNICNDLTGSDISS